MDMDGYGWIWMDMGALYILVTTRVTTEKLWVSLKLAD